MSPQDKATTERNARTLREFVKKPENKVCADCKRNDPRWASWNLGVYLCIRCSGIHRGMGTHISKVKSIDLDTWTPEQMQSIEKWGNRRANLYWEAHLRAGHLPPDHKMESFIRSKYESRRWALDGPPPPDPSILDDEASSPTQAPEAPPAKVSSRPTHIVNSSTSSLSRTAVSPPLTTRQPQPHQLLSTTVAADRRTQVSLIAPSVAVPIPPQAQPKASEPENDLFNLDFHAPPSFGNSDNTATQQPKKDVKQDILSLFSSKPAALQPKTFGQIQSSGSPWDSFGAPQTQPPSTSMIGTNGVGAWGTSSGWSAAAPAPPAQGNLWGNPPPALPDPPTQQKQSDLFGSDIWGGSSTAPGGVEGLWGASGAGSEKKDDAFGDIWGGFK